jgi:Icc-related predicted phosphoesterase
MCFTVNQNNMRILHLSDTHNHHHLLHDLPAADVIVHSGDFSFFSHQGSRKDFVDFSNWFGGLDYRYKIFVAGNHDNCLDGKNHEIIQGLLPANCFYLCNSGVTIEGLKFWGVPYFFSDDVNGNFPKIMSQIPADTDILITHRPPYRILDKTGNNYGCPDLLLAVLRIAPRYHLFGHVHGAYGIDKSRATTFVNASLTNEKYELVNKPFVIDV